MRNQIKTGVVQANYLEWIWDDACDGVDLQWKEFICDNDEETVENIDMWEQGDALIGFQECAHDDDEAWFGHKGEYGSFGYKPDPEAEYSAIYRSDSYVLQVVRSQWIRLSPFCSPCYPNQGDLDSPPEAAGGGVSWTLSNQHGPVWAYTVPPDLVGEHGEQQLRHTAVRYYPTYVEFCQVNPYPHKATFEEIASGIGQPYAYGDKPIPRRMVNDGIILKDNVRVSIQVGSDMMCNPKSNYGPHHSFEVAIYGMGRSTMLREYYSHDGIYGYVPKHVLERFIKYHGGVA